MEHDETEKRQRLKQMLEQIAGDSGIDSIREDLQSATSPESGESFDMVTSDDGLYTVESLDSFISNGVETIDQYQFEALEAIIHKRYRPAMYVNDDTYKTGPSPWNKLLEGKTRARLEAAIPSIGRIDLPRHPSIPYAGTGFIVGPGLVMTNRHVAAYFVSGKGRQVYFTEGQSAIIDMKQEQGSKAKLVLEIVKPVMVHPYWDMALLQVDGLPEGLRPLELSVDDPEELLSKHGDYNVVAIGYPAQDPRNDYMDQIKIFESFEVKRLQPGVLRKREMYPSYGKEVNAITHDCSTLGGNSGSAILDIRTGQVLGLHFAGEYMKANYAVPTYELASDSFVVDAGVNFKSSIAPGDAYDRYWTSGNSNSEEQATPRGNIQNAQNTSVKIDHEIRRDDTGEDWIIPIHLNIRVGTPTRKVRPEISKAGDEREVGEEWLWGRRQPEITPVFDLASLAATEFNWKTALSTAMASELVYENSETVSSKVLNEWGFADCNFMDIKRTQCFVASADSIVLVSFRGTKELNDWLTNLDVMTSKKAFGSVHRGFNKAFEVIERNIVDILELYPKHSIVITGHSLGGAIANLAGGHWMDRFPITSIYTFGQPAAGKGKIYKRTINDYYRGKFFRFVNDDDVVPKVPPLYSHVGELYHLDPKGRLKERKETLAAEVPILSKEEFAELQAVLRATAGSSGETEGLLPSFIDHSIARYIQKIAGLAE